MQAKKGPESRASFDGEWLEHLTIPAGLADPSARRSEKDGLESLALDPTFGLLTLPKQPLATQPRTTHTIHSSRGDKFAFDTSGIGTMSIKAMKVLADGRIAMIERNVSALNGGPVPWLRILDSGSCESDGICAIDAARIEVPGIKDADCAGFAQISDDLFWS